MKKRKLHEMNVHRIQVNTVFKEDGMVSELVIYFTVAGDEYTAHFDLPQGYTEDSIRALLKIHGFSQ